MVSTIEAVMAALALERMLEQGVVAPRRAGQAVKPWFGALFFRRKRCSIGTCLVRCVPISPLVQLARVSRR